MPIARTFKLLWIKALVLVAVVVAIGVLVSVVKELHAPRVPSLVEGPSENLLVGRRFTNPGQVGAFTLIDQHGQSFERDRMLGRWSFVFFGYTFCPDLCPTTLVVFQQIRRLLGDEPKLQVGLQFLLVTVDPERDTPRVLDSYVSYFGSGLLGLTGNEDTIRALAEQLGVFFRRVDQPGGNYVVDHSGSILLIDPEGRLAATFPAPHQPKALVEAFRGIRDRSSSVITGSAL